MKTISFILTLCFMIGCNQNKQESSNDGINPTDILVADETWCVLPQDDDIGRSLIFSYNEELREQLNDYEGVESLQIDILSDSSVVEWFIINNNQSADVIMNTIEDRNK